MFIVPPSGNVWSIDCAGPSDLQYGHKHSHRTRVRGNTMDYVNRYNLYSIFLSVVVLGHVLCAFLS